MKGLSIADRVVCNRSENPDFDNIEAILNVGFGRQVRYNGTTGAQESLVLKQEGPNEWIDKIPRVWKVVLRGLQFLALIVFFPLSLPILAAREILRKKLGLYDAKVEALATTLQRGLSSAPGSQSSIGDALTQSTIYPDWKYCRQQIEQATTKRILNQENGEYFLLENALHEIIPGVFLTGSYQPEKVIRLPSRINVRCYIEFAVGLTNENVGEYLGESLKLNIGFKDFENQMLKDNFIKFFNEAADKIDEKLSEGKSVVIYCQQGMDRSPAFLAHYLLKKTGLDPNTYRDNVYNFIRKVRVIAQDVRLTAEEGGGMTDTYFGLMQEALYPNVAPEGGGGGSKEN